MAEQDQRKRPVGINRYLDSQGRLKELPAKHGKRMAALAYLALKVESGRDYTEEEINAVCDAWSVFGDYCIVRRELVDEGFLQRDSYGSRYWRKQSREELAAMFMTDKGVHPGSTL